MTSVSRVVLLLASAALLSACDDDKKTAQNRQGPPPAAATSGKIYKDLDACLADAGDMDQVKACREGYQQALEKMAEAPRFEERARCEDVYGPGNCVPRGSVVHEGGGGFVPFMMGYMLGGGFGGRTVYQPVFIDRGGSYYAGNAPVSNPRWSGSVPPSAPHAATVPSSVARGGFGSTAATSATAGG
jgi:uncharacterized protein YgiB involved in biofilm formation